MSAPMPTPEEQAALDASQDSEIDKVQTDLALVADYLRAQGNFIPESIAQGPEEKKPGPRPTSELQLWGNDGYRIFPYNGGWYSFRGKDLESHRKALIRSYAVSENEFYKCKIDGEIIIIPYGEAEGEISPEVEE